MPALSQRCVDYAAGFHDGYLQAVEEVNELLGIVAPDPRAEVRQARVKLVTRVLKFLGLGWR